MQPQAHATMRDIPFPSGYRGLPLEPVALGLRVMDALAEQHPVLRDPVLRKFNVLGFVTSWLLDRYQNRQTAAFDDPEIAQLYEGVKAERSRLAATFPPESRQPHANGHRRL